MPSWHNINKEQYVCNGFTLRPNSYPDFRLKKRISQHCLNKTISNDKSPGTDITRLTLKALKALTCYLTTSLLKYLVLPKSSRIETGDENNVCHQLPIVAGRAKFSELIARRIVRCARRINHLIPRRNGSFVQSGDQSLLGAVYLWIHVSTNEQSAKNVEQHILQQSVAIFRPYRSIFKRIREIKLICKGQALWT